MPSRYTIFASDACNDPHLTDGDIRVLAALGSFHNDKRGCYPGVKALMKKSGKGRRTVQRALDLLERRGYITRGLRHGRSSIYSVLLDTHLRSTTERHGWRTPRVTGDAQNIPTECSHLKGEAENLLPGPAAPDGAGPVWLVSELAQSLVRPVGVRDDRSWDTQDDDSEDNENDS